MVSLPRYTDSPQVPFHTIIEVTDTTSPSEVNAKLASGWILLHVGTGASCDHDYTTGIPMQSSEPIYVLGRPRPDRRIASGGQEAQS